MSEQKTPIVHIPIDELVGISNAMYLTHKLIMTHLSIP
jgi:hypothetical protein